MLNTALIQVLGGVSYGEWKAFELTQTKAALATSRDQQDDWTQIAAEEKRHFEGFVARLRAHGGDAERAMAPFRRTLDYFHSGMPSSGIEEGIWMYLGEGVANDLLVWLRDVVDAETSAFIDSVLADEVGHEGRAAKQLRTLMAEHPDHRREARRAVRRMMRRMLRSGRYAPAPLLAFLRIGKAPQLVAAIVGGFARRLHAIDAAAAGAANVADQRVKGY
ncbi:MAG: ferritin-like fold-containing protein [Kofleriaceae bacterium]